jgi:hypothetical protein
MEAMTPNPKRWNWLAAHLAWHDLNPRRMTHPETGNAMQTTIEMALALQRLTPTRLDNLADVLGFERESFDRVYQAERLGIPAGKLVNPMGLLPATGQTAAAPDPDEALDALPHLTAGEKQTGLDDGPELPQRLNIIYQEGN